MSTILLGSLQLFMDSTMNLKIDGSEASSTIVISTDNFDIFLADYTFSASDDTHIRVVAKLVMVMLQRTSISLMLYLRVHAIYPSNRYIQITFLFLITGVALSCIVAPYYSGFTSGCFDLAILLAIFWKLVWKSGAHWQTTVLSLFRSGTSGQIRDRFLRDSLFYVLWALCFILTMEELIDLLLSHDSVTVLIKIPQIYFWTARTPFWPTFMMMPDAVITCILAGKIYRDMKLGHTRNTRENETSIIPHLSGINFMDISSSGRMYETSRVTSLSAWQPKGLSNSEGIQVYHPKYAV